MSKDDAAGERPRAEPEIIPPGAPDPRGRGNIFYEFERDGFAHVRVTRIVRFKLTLILFVAAVVALTLVLMFASFFIVAAVIAACATAIAVAVAWVKRLF